MSCLVEVERIVKGLVDREHGEGTPWGLGSQQGDRLREVAAWCARSWPGDLIEIGCYTGGTTRLLAGVAREHGRRVLAVDPWGDDPAIYARFVENMRGFEDVLDVVRLPSQYAEAVAQIRERALCFAFVDGLHTRAALLSDLEAVAHCAGVVAVDDVSYECQPEDLRPACWEGAARTGRALYWHPRCREGYLVPVG